MGGLQKRRDLRPRRAREREAYRLVLVGGSTGVAGVITVILTVAGVTGALVPIVLLVIAGWCGWRFRRITGRR